jgi:penicillin-binding protein 1C
MPETSVFPARIRPWIRVAAIVVAVAGFGAVSFIGWAVWPLLGDVPPARGSTVILARDGKTVLRDLGAEGGRSVPVRLDQMPASVQEAVLAAEDARFYGHHGIDLKSLAQAAIDNLRAGERVRGASTVEQQLVKTLYFPDQPRTFLQKVREAIAASWWAMGHSKEETLERYLNEVPMGRSQGIGAASLAYFHADVSQLSLGQAAMLAGTIAAPSAYDPARFRAKAEQRQAFVLNRLEALGWADPDAIAAARSAYVRVEAPPSAFVAPHFAFRVEEELASVYPDLRTGGYRIVTTLDPALQSAAEKSVARRLEELSKRDVDNAAALAIDPRNGDVLAYVGSADFFDESILGQNDMVQAARQPGSALKPFLAFLAFRSGYAPASILPDIPVQLTSPDGTPYAPRNYSLRFNGPVSIRDALGSSLNVPFVVLLDRLGIDAFHGLLGDFGLRFPEAPSHYGLSIVLGGGEVTLWDAVRAYARLDAMRAVELRTVLRVERNDVAVFEAEDRVPEPLFAKDAAGADRAAAQVAEVLRDPSARLRAFGQETALAGPKPGIAAKTGTTKDFRDNWAFGYTPDTVVGVWVGHADGRPMQGVSGITGAVPIWSDIFAARYRNTEVPDWPDPGGWERVDVCIDSGLRVSPDCPASRRERFVPGTAPTALDDWHERCADGRTYLRPPPEYLGWAASAKKLPPPGVCPPRPETPLRILAPLDGDAYARSELVGAASQGIPFLASGERGRYVWILDGKRLETPDPAYIWTPLPGRHELHLEGSSETIHFTVQ